MALTFIATSLMKQCGIKWFWNLRYEAREVEKRSVVQQDRIDAWFGGKTRGLTGVAKAKLKQRWGNLQKMFSSKARLGQIVADIVFDMETKPRLHDGRGNAMFGGWQYLSGV